VLHAAFSYAVEIGKLAKNPCDHIKLPRKEKRKQTILTADQARQLIDACQDLLSDANDWQLGAVLLLLLTTGLRIGEALSLHWRDIDMEKRVVTVDRTLSYDKEQHVQYEADPKSESSKREITLPQLALTTLSAHRINQLKLRLLIPEWEDHDLVFTSYCGKHTWRNSISKKFRKFCQDHNLPHLHPHDLRHNVSTALLAAGVSMKTIQGMLGHSKISTTMDLYAWVTPEMKQSAANEIDQIFGHS
jgi:integrase